MFSLYEADGVDPLRWMVIYVLLIVLSGGERRRRRRRRRRRSRKEVEVEEKKQEGNLHKFILARSVSAELNRKKEQNLLVVRVYRISISSVDVIDEAEIEPRKIFVLFVRFTLASLGLRLVCANSH